MARPQAAVLRGVIAAIDAHGPMTLRQLLDVVRVDCGAYDRAATLCELRVALSNGLHTGRKPLERAGKVRVPHCSRWCVLYGVREVPAPVDVHLALCGQAAPVDRLQALGAAMQSWFSAGTPA
jgi:hypothetical protein